MDTVKANLQVQDPKNPRYSGTLHCLRAILGKDGIRGIYRGVTSPLAGIATANAIVFGVYGNTQRYSSDPNSLLTHFCAGSASGLFQSFLTGPLDLLKLRMQVSNRHPTVFSCLRHVHKLEGTRGVFRGLALTVCRDVPGFSIYFCTYEMLTRTEDGSPVSTCTMLASGGVAGVLSWALPYPVDVIKTRMQVDGMHGSPVYKNALDCVKKSVGAEGIACLYHGITPALLRAFPVNAACFVVVTWTMRLLQAASGKNWWGDSSREFVYVSSIDVVTT